MNVRLGLVAVALGGLLGGARADINANGNVAVNVAVDSYLSLEAVDPVIFFINSNPTSTGWIVAESVPGVPDVSGLTVGCNAPVTVTLLTGTGLTNLQKTLPTQFSFRYKGKGTFNGTPFTSLADFTAWDAFGNAPRTGVAAFTAGRSSLETKAQIYRDGLNDPPGFYYQVTAMTLVVSPGS
ncbi:MAG: hypothetical protein IT204_23830 [Fimbriimonadaceae bacterium]|nr:hypothetical protein [Fimbriimonadaceae bacterium]